MDKIYVLGTGTASSIDNYNTCFILEDKNHDYLLVDAGGGNGILKQLKECNIDYLNIHNIFISHKHIDHMLGVIWLYRNVEIAMKNGIYDGILNIYCNDEVAALLTFLIKKLLRKEQQKYLDKRIFINSVKDHETVKILNYNIEFLDLHAKSDIQYGFKTVLNNGKVLVFTGDEPMDESLYDDARNADYLLHEAFCLEEESMYFKPREKNHDTVAFAALKASKIGIRNLVLWNSNDNLGKNRKDKYSKEALKYFNGNVYVPDDLDIIEL